MSLTDYQINTINKILSIPSVGGQETTNAPYGELPKLALDTFLEEAKNNGFRTGIIDNKVGWIEIGSGDKLIGIVCHLDVVPAGDGWNTDPFVPTYKDGKIYARGIVDDKGPALISYFAMKSILDNNIPVNSRIRLILGSDEERTCDCVETYAVKGEIPSFAFTPDAEFPVVFAEKGILQLKISGKGTSAITVKGGSAANMVPSLAEACFDQKQIIANGKAAHASKPHLGVNAIDNLVKDLASNGLAGAAELLSFMDKYIVNNTSEQITGCSIIDESGSITTNEGIIRINDDEQYLVIDIRYPISASKDDIVNTISNKASEFNLEVTVNGHMNPLYKDKNSSEIDILTSIWKRHIKNYDGFENGYESNPEYTSPVAMGGGTYARHMPNTIAFGIQAPWAIDQCHQANECMSINDFEESIEVVKEAIIELSNN